MRTSPPVGHVTAAVLTPVELVRFELPSLGSEFKGRAAFVDEVIANLDEMQEVHVYWVRVRYMCIEAVWPHTQEFVILVPYFRTLP